MTAKMPKAHEPLARRITIMPRMPKVRQSLARRITVLNVMVSAAAVVLACLAFLAYEVNSFRLNIDNDLSIQAQIIGSNAASALIFNDSSSAQKTLAALQASPHITYAGIYTPAGQFFAGYWRDTKGEPKALPVPPTLTAESHWFANWRANLVRPIIFDGKNVGTVYIRSDLQGLISRAGTYAIILASILAVSLIGALFASRIWQRKITEPVVELTETARVISRDRNYALRATPISTEDEIAFLIGSFNEMLSEIQIRDTTLQESERQFRTLADSLPQLTWIAEADGAIFWYNQRWYDYTGTSPEEMMGWGWQSVHDPARLAEVVEKWTASIKTGQRFTMIFPLRGQDGKFRDFLTMAVPIRDNTGKVVRWFGTNTDVTEQRRSEEALRQTEKLAATGRLAASIAHEINNPLEALTNLIYLARKNPGKSESYLAIADQELDHIAEITKHTLGFYRDTTTPVQVNIAEVLHEVLELYSRKLQFKNISIKEQYEAGAGILGYPGELRQIFANLVANAIEAMQQSGHLSIKTSTVHNGASGNTAGVRVSVMDDGCGIEKSQMKKIFEPFYTTKKDVGTGLGLWLTQNLVAKHNGHIHVRSKVDHEKSWTVFSVFLPQDLSVGRSPIAGTPGNGVVSSR
jgi:PAS domain S-box-containing protein